MPPRAVQWAFDISFGLRTVVAAGVGNLLEGRILPLVFNLPSHSCVWNKESNVETCRGVLQLCVTATVQDMSFQLLHLSHQHVGEV